MNDHDIDNVAEDFEPPKKRRRVIQNTGSRIQDTREAEKEQEKQDAIVAFNIFKQQFQ